jgi:hypothetical protein
MSRPFRKKAQPVPIIETVSREELIARLRRELTQFTDVETSVCKAAAEHGVFCKGFQRYTEPELRSRYGWIVAKRPDLSREELDEVANDWQLAQQEVHEMPIACDVQRKVHDTCRGWNDFTSEQLAKFYYQMTGKEIQVA